MKSLVFGVKGKRVPQQLHTNMGLETPTWPIEHSLLFAGSAEAGLLRVSAEEALCFLQISADEQPESIQPLPSLMYSMY